jgi:hypothetical protein
MDAETQRNSREFKKRTGGGFGSFLSLFPSNSQRLGVSASKRVHGVGVFGCRYITNASVRLVPF